LIPTDVILETLGILIPLLQVCHIAGIMISYQAALKLNPIARKVDVAVIALGPQIFEIIR